MNNMLYQDNMISDMIDRIPGGIGIYNLYPDNRIIMEYLNDGFFAIMGTTREKMNSYLDYSINEVVHPDDIGEVISDLFRAIKNNTVANTDFRVMTDIGEYTWINWNCKAAHKTKEKTVLYAFFNNIDKIKRISLQIEASQRVLGLAKSEGKVTIWLFDIKKRQIITDLLNESQSDPEGIIKNVPESIIYSGGVMERDKHTFANAFNMVSLGEERSECVVRILNTSNEKYEWRRLLIMRIHDNYYDRPMAFVISVDIDKEHKAKLCYEREFTLRQELLKDAIIYYQINLTTGYFEEYVCKAAKFVNIGRATQTSEKIRNQILQGVVEEDRELVRNTIFSDALKEAYEAGVKTGECIYRRFMKGGGKHWVKANASMIKKPDTDHIIALIYVKDIDESVKDKLAISSIINEEIESSCIVDVESQRAHFIRKNNRMYIHNKSESINYQESITDIIAENVIEEDQQYCRQFFSLTNLVSNLERSNSSTITFRCINSKGAIRRKKTLAFFLDDTQKSIVMYMQDITRLYEDEQAQKELLQKAVDAANYANKAKSEFLSRLSYDMRTPLNSLIGLTTLAIEEDDWKKARDYLKKIQSTGNRLIDLINENLELSHIESGKIDLNEENYSIYEFKKDIDAVIKPLMDKKNIEFIFNVNWEAESIYVDKLRFCQVFINLLSNAAQFTEPGGRVEFISETIAGDDFGRHGIRFHVCDTGVGISEEYQKHIFEPFSQDVFVKKGEYKSSSLGLVIVKSIVDSFGGKIQVKSTLGKGTEFIVDVFVFYGDTLSTLENKGKENFDNLKGAHVLIVEDNKSNAAIAKQLLEVKECIVDIAQNGLKGVEAFCSSEIGYYDIIIMDLVMPVMNGLEAAETIRSLDRCDGKTIPIIAISADVFSENYTKVLKAGMNGHISKPVDTKVMYSTISRQLEKSYY